MGFSIAAKGFDSIEWDVVNKIMMSWLISPLVSGILGFLFFASIKFLVLKQNNPFERAYYAFPAVLTIFIGIDIFYILYKGFNNTKLQDTLELKHVLPISFGVGLVCGLIWIVIVGPWAKGRINDQVAKTQAAKDQTATEQIHVDNDMAMEYDDIEEIDVDAWMDTRAKECAGVKTNHNDDKEAAGHIDVALATVAKPAPPVKNTKELESDADTEVSDGEDKRGRTWLEKAFHDFGESTYNQDLQAQSMHESGRGDEI